MLIEIVLTTYVGSNRLYALRRLFSDSFRKITILIFTLQMTPTLALLTTNITAQLGPCWGHLQTENQQCDFSETFREWSSYWVEPIKTQTHDQKIFLQLIQLPWTSPETFICMFRSSWSNVEAISELKKKNATSLKLEKTHLLSILSRLEPSNVFRTIFFNTHRPREYRRKQ